MPDECNIKCSGRKQNAYNSRKGFKLFGVMIDDYGDSSIRRSKSMGNLQARNGDNPTGEASGSGYLSDGLVHSRLRKKGKPWSEEEHRSFLMGLEKLGKGDWKGIANNFVPSRNSTQVASHAQKYFNRLASTERKRRRTSVFDIPLTDTNQPSQAGPIATSERPPLSPMRTNGLPGYQLYRANCYANNSSSLDSSCEFLCLE